LISYQFQERVRRYSPRETGAPTNRPIERSAPTPRSNNTTVHIFYYQLHQRENIRAPYKEGGVSAPPRDITPEKMLWLTPTRVVPSAYVSPVINRYRDKSKKKRTLLLYRFILLFLLFHCDMTCGIHYEREGSFACVEAHEAVMEPKDRR